jgi:hypothetical protein
MRLAFWPGLSGEADSFSPLELEVHAPGLEVVLVDPRYAARDDWRLEALAADLIATGADVYGGTSWGAAVAATAAALQPPTALVLLEGGFVQPPADTSWIDDVVAAAPENDWAYGEPTLRAILRAFSEYDAAATLAPIAGAVPTLAVASDQIDGRHELVEERASWADVRFVAAGHDVVGELGSALGALVCDWLLARVAA